MKGFAVSGSLRSTSSLRVQRGLRGEGFQLLWGPGFCCGCPHLLTQTFLLSSSFTLRYRPDVDTPSLRDLLPRLPMWPVLYVPSKRGGWPAGKGRGPLLSHRRWSPGKEGKEGIVPWAFLPEATVEEAKWVDWAEMLSWRGEGAWKRGEQEGEPQF